MMMTDKEFEREFNYSLMLHYLKILKGRGIITDEEFKDADMLLLKKYNPVIGSLMSENFSEF